MVMRLVIIAVMTMTMHDDPPCIAKSSIISISNFSPHFQSLHCITSSSLKRKQSFMNILYESNQQTCSLIFKVCIASHFVIVELKTIIHENPLYGDEADDYNGD